MRRPGCVLAVALLAGAAPAGCAPSPASEVTIGRSAWPPSTPAPTPADGSDAVTFTVSSFDVAGAADPASVARAQAAVGATFTRYLDVAVLGPLRSGGPAGDLAPLFTAHAAAHLAAAPQPNPFVDEGLPAASRIAPLVSGLRLSGLADQRGEVVLVAARMDLRLAAEAQGTTITIDRVADVLLVPDGHAWKIDSYWVRVARDTHAPSGASQVVVRS